MSTDDAPKKTIFTQSLALAHHPPNTAQDPSHIALEVAMQTHPNMVLLAEDVRAKRWSLHDIVREISDVVQTRSDMGKEFGTVVVSTKALDVRALAAQPGVTENVLPQERFLDCQSFRWGARGKRQARIFF